MGRLQTPSGKCLHQPIALNIADMLDAFEVNGHCMHGGGEGKASNSLGEAPTPACWFQALNIVDMLDAIEVSGIQHGRVCGGVGFKLLQGSAYTSPSLSVS